MKVSKSVRATGAMSPRTVTTKAYVPDSLGGHREDVPDQQTGEEELLNARALSVLIRKTDLRNARDGLRFRSSLGLHRFRSTGGNAAPGSPHETLAKVHDVLKRGVHSLTNIGRESVYAVAKQCDARRAGILLHEHVQATNELGRGKLLGLHGHKGLRLLLADKSPHVELGKLFLQKVQQLLTRLAPPHGMASPPNDVGRPRQRWVFARQETKSERPAARSVFPWQHVRSLMIRRHQFARLQIFGLKVWRKQEHAVPQPRARRRQRHRIEEPRSFFAPIPLAFLRDFGTSPFRIPVLQGLSHARVQAVAAHDEPGFHLEGLPSLLHLSLQQEPIRRFAPQLQALECCAIVPLHSCTLCLGV
eukprot:scaffold6180_cov200-Pinguiococcus_pyrenoidosus.AAC.2